MEPRTEAFSWKMCGSNTEALQIKTLSVAPDPIKVPGNVTMAFSASVKFPEPIDSPIEVSGPLQVPASQTLSSVRIVNIFIKTVNSTLSCNLTSKRVL